MLWSVGVVSAAVGGVLTSFISGLLGPVLDPDAFRDKLSSDQPVKAIAITQDADYGWVFDHALESKAVADFDVAQNGAGGDDAGMQHFLSLNGWARTSEGVNVVLQSRRAKPVTITRLTPHVISCTSAPQAAAVLDMPQGGGENMHLVADLDLSDPYFAASTTPRTAHQRYFDDHRITLAPEEVYAVRIVAYAFTKACTWDIKVDAIVDGQPTSFTLDSNGQSFRVAGQSTTYQQIYVHDYASGSPPPHTYRPKRAGDFWCKTTCQNAIDNPFGK